MCHKLLWCVVGLLALLALPLNSGCDRVKPDDFLKGLENALSSGLTKENIVKGLKAALRVAADTSAAQAHAENGYYGNQLIKILAPEPIRDLQCFLNDNYSNPIVQGVLSGASTALNSAVENMVKSLNHAAEEAAGEAFPIFERAVVGMTIQDGLAILQGGPHSATDFLQQKTEEELKVAFAPIVARWVDAGDVSRYWKNVMSMYNKYAPLAKPLAKGMGYELADRVDEDLYSYATEQALKGLFSLSAREEEKIRRDPKGYVTTKWSSVKDIISRVFGSAEAQKALK